jgi:hypothetical protein
MNGRRNSTEIGKMRKTAIVAYFKVTYQHLTGMTKEKQRKILVNIAGLRDGIPKQDVLNMKC